MAEKDKTTNGWNEWAKAVLTDLEELKASSIRTNEEVIRLRIEMAVLKTKAAVFGVITGTVVTIIANIIISFMRKP
jgi:hypothetical protein